MQDINPNFVIIKKRGVFCVCYIKLAIVNNIYDLVSN